MSGIGLGVMSEGGVRKNEGMVISGFLITVIGILPIALGVGICAFSGMAISVCQNSRRNRKKDTIT